MWVIIFFYLVAGVYFAYEIHLDNLQIYYRNAFWKDFWWEFSKAIVTILLWFPMIAIVVFFISVIVIIALIMTPIRSDHQNQFHYSGR